MTFFITYIIYTSGWGSEGLTHVSRRGAVSFFLPVIVGDLTSIVQGSIGSVPFCGVEFESWSGNCTCFLGGLKFGEGSSVAKEVCAPVGLWVGVGRVSW